MNDTYKRIFNSLALIFLCAAASVFAQSPQPQATPSCPTVRVSSPDSTPASQPIIYSADVSGGDSSMTPTFNWTISGGTISSGQGTSSISVDTSGMENQSITATVDVGGYDRSCSASSSGTTLVTKKVETKKFDEFGKLKPADQQKRFDNYAVALRADPTATGYIIAYGGRRSQPDEAQKLLDATTDYLNGKRGIAPERTLVAVGGYREEPTLEFWIAPEGGAPPMATPTVDPSEVKPAKVNDQPTKPQPKAKPKSGKKS